MSLPHPHTPRRSRALPGLLLAGLALLAGCGGGDAPATEQASEDGTLVEHVVTVLEPQFPDAPYEIDLGHLAFGQTASHVVQLRNDSGAPLVVRSIRPGCSCTTPVLTYVDPTTGNEVRADARGRGDVATIPPGVAFGVELAVDSTVAPAKNTHKVVVVRMTTDSPVEPYVTFNLRVFVESHFLPTPAVLDLGTVSMNGGAQGTLTLRADSPDGRRLVAISSSPRDVMAGLSERTEGAATLWDLQVQLLPPVASGPQRWTLELATSGPDGEGEGPAKEVEVRALGAPDVAIEPAIVLLDPTPVGEAATNLARVVSRLAGQRLRVTAARVEGDLAAAFRAEAVPHTPDDAGAATTWTLRLVATAAPADGVVSGRLVVELADLEPATVEARLHYRP